MKKNILKLTFILVFTVLLSACHTKTDKTVIKFASWGSKTEIQILKPILADYEKLHPDIKIEFLHIPQNYFEKIHLLFASNLAPDVIFINNLNIPIYAKHLEDLTSCFDFTPFYKKSVDVMRFNEKIYAVPRDVSNLVIYYNKDIFDKYHVPYPETSWTIKDFLNTAQKLTKKNLWGISFDKEPMYYLPYLMSEGTGIISDDLKTLIINDPKSQQTIAFYADLRNKYHIAPKSSESASATMAQMFLQQKLAMHLSGRWIVPKYREAANFNWDIINFPNGAKGSIVPMDSSGWAISKASNHKEESVEFIKYLSSNKNIKKMTQSGLITPARIDTANSTDFLAPDKLPKSSYIFLEVIKTSKKTPVSTNYKELTDNINTKFEPLFNP